MPAVLSVRLLTITMPAVLSVSETAYLNHACSVVRE
jgi:hypothetical protein